MRDPITELATVGPIPLAPVLRAARPILERVAVDVLAIPDDALGDVWHWHSSERDNERRYGVYRMAEALEEAAAAVSLGRAAGTGAAIGPAVPLLASAAAARWDLHGVLVALPEQTWDADPGGGEWTIRQTLGHTVGGQRSYSWYNAWYIHRGLSVADAVYPPDGELPEEPSEEVEGSGSPDEVRARLDEVVDTAISATAALDRSALGLGGRWVGEHVSIEFRIGRYGSHIREHTIQVDKTLTMLGHQPTEAARLVRHVFAAYGRLEGLLVGRPEDVLSARFEDGTDAPTIVTSALAEVSELARRVKSEGRG